MAGMDGANPVRVRRDNSCYCHGVFPRTVEVFHGWAWSFFRVGPCCPGSLGVVPDCPMGSRAGAQVGNAEVGEIRARLDSARHRASAEAGTVPGQGVPNETGCPQGSRAGCPSG